MIVLGFSAGLTCSDGARLYLEPKVEVRAVSRILGASSLPNGVPLPHPYPPDVLSCRLMTLGVLQPGS